jgi:GNAT superfamily N-acetyltransferase
VLIGFISFTKVPLLKLYAIHSFYIYPPYRNRGHGKKLLVYTCDHVKKLGAQRIYIQPGPFEIVDGVCEKIVDETHRIKIQKLITLYKNAGFTFVNRFISRCAAIIYPILGISENAQYLMVKQ